MQEKNLQSEGLANLITAAEDLHSFAGKAIVDGIDKMSTIESLISSNAAILDRIDSAYDQMRPQLEELKNAQGGAKPTGDIDKHIDTLLRMKESEPIKHVLDELYQQVGQSIIENFQVSNPLRLCGGNGLLIGANIEGLGANSSKNKLGFVGVSIKDARAMEQYSRALYLESPVFWRLKNALESVERFHPRQVPDVPKYFHDMAKVIKREYTGGIGLSDVSENIADTIGGRVVVDAITGNLLFNEKDGGEHPLHLAAMGVANFGMLGLLIEKNLLDENTVLFIDEPEAHLHPAWQVAMAEVLFTLAERGVNIVIATHSADILKWLQVHAKENPDVEKIVALNHFQKGGTVESSDDFLETLSGIQDDLTAPYQDMFIRGLRA